MDDNSVADFESDLKNLLASLHRADDLAQIVCMGDLLAPAIEIVKERIALLHPPTLWRDPYYRQRLFNHPSKERHG